MTSTPTLIDTALRDDVRLLGELLGQVISADRGPGFLDCIETIRGMAKAARQGADAQWQALSRYLANLPDDVLVDVTRAFNQFLNLANLADQHHQARELAREATPYVVQQLQQLSDRGVPATDLAAALRDLRIELVLTAHPTEVLRRTMIQKYNAISQTLGAHDRALSARERQQLRAQLIRYIAEAWHTDEIRAERPTPQDEARSGFAVIEHSLWHALPAMMRELDAAVDALNLAPLPLTCMPIRFCAWMGGDRDGNPNVTAEVTAEVLRLARWMAADLYLRDLEHLLDELSMEHCTAALRARVGNSKEPYRSLLRVLRERLRVTRDANASAAALAANDAALAGSDATIRHVDELLEPLTLCYHSLRDCGAGAIARGSLLNTLRRLACFGVDLVRLDIRQSADRHTEVFDEITAHLGLYDAVGRSYAQWQEPQRRAFLLRELKSGRPLFPPAWPASPAAREVLDTFDVIAANEGRGITAYVISMAAEASDVLAVILLLKQSGLQSPLPVVPLFETLDDLNNAAACLDALLHIPWYHGWCRGEQMIMIGYSDSAKDAGQLAAAWAQYRAQEQVAAVAQQHGVRLTLFHGRGGAVGRGGGPSHSAILSQPPGTVAGRLRVTEQGEMVRFKLGQPEVAAHSLGIYLAATLEATLLPPAKPADSWRALMTTLADSALHGYRELVRGTDNFVPFFAHATPEEELGTLALGSRPARRRASNDISSLRAIPWVFSWTQIRLMLPAWLGTEEAFALELDPEQRAAFQQMTDQWPFFIMQMDMLEMVLAKMDLLLAGYYADRLVPSHLRGLMTEIQQRAERLVKSVSRLTGKAELLQHDPRLRASLEVRNTYLDPLHLMQAELLARRRAGQRSAEVTRALQVTMSGISSGLRNTG